jgi:hypothetical protein
LLFGKLNRIPVLLETYQHYYQQKLIWWKNHMSESKIISFSFSFSLDYHYSLLLLVFFYSWHVLMHVYKDRNIYNSWWQVRANKNIRWVT